MCLSQSLLSKSKRANGKCAASVDRQPHDCGVMVWERSSCVLELPWDCKTNCAGDGGVRKVDLPSSIGTQRKVNVSQISNTGMFFVWLIEIYVIIALWHRTCVSGQQISGVTIDTHDKREPMLHTTWIIRNQRMDSPENYGRTLQTWPKKNQSMKLFTMIFCYTQKSVPCFVIIREASSGSRWEQVKRYIMWKENLNFRSPLSSSPQNSGNPTME